MKRQMTGVLAAAALAGWTLAYPGVAAESPPAVRQDTTRADFVSLGNYIGHWRSEEKRQRDGGRAFRFEYQLTWFDRHKTILRMTISQVFDDGEKKLWWNGYKGWDPVKHETWYHGFSPLGRVAAGKFVDAGDHFITWYTAFDSSGQTVELRDVFTAVENGTFDNVTWLRPNGESEWRIVARDKWRRVQ